MNPGTLAGTIAATAIIVLLVVNCARTDPIIECVGSHPITDMELTQALNKCATMGITIPEEYYP